MRDTGGDPGICKGSRKFELFRPRSCPESKVLFNGASDVTFANSFSPESIEGGEGVNTG